MPNFADIASVEADIGAIRRGVKEGDVEALIVQHAKLLEEVIGPRELATWDSNAVLCVSGGQTFRIYRWPESYWPARQALIQSQRKFRLWTSVS